VGYRHRDVYTAYLDLGSPAGLPEKPSLLADDVLAILREKSTEPLETRRITATPNRPLSLDLPINQNDVYLVIIDPLGKSK
jgi:hypothetical protein